MDSASHDSGDISVLVNAFHSLKALLHASPGVEVARQAFLGLVLLV